MSGDPDTEPDMIMPISLGLNSLTVNKAVVKRDAGVRKARPRRRIVVIVGSK